MTNEILFNVPDIIKAMNADPKRLLYNMELRPLATTIRHGNAEEASEAANVLFNAYDRALDAIEDLGQRSV